VACKLGDRAVGCFTKPHNDLQISTEIFILTGGWYSSPSDLGDHWCRVRPGLGVSYIHRAPFGANYLQSGRDLFEAVQCEVSRGPRRKLLTGIW